MGAATESKSAEEAEPLESYRLARLALVTLGVVYGDIGTSPLYALRECFFGEHSVAPTESHVLGVLSLIFWSLTLVISVKYLIFVLRADNRGEGGILALMALIKPGGGPRWVYPMLVMLGLGGAALLYGDGMITPAISVLSAIEGLKVATPVFDPYVVPITIAVLVGLFALQRHGTDRVGTLFGPLMIIWFGVIAALGARAIVRHPEVLWAINPYHALEFLASGGVRGYLVLGAVFLVVTGGEALYADMGHFGPRPIRLDWFAFVLPALLLNYFGQGALLLAHPETAHNTFYRLAPAWGIYPLVALSTAATVIASQAVISGVFSLTRQAVHMGYLPRIHVTHTSAEERGQIYVAPMNGLLLAATILLVLGFKNSSNLAAAYGVAVTITMAITTTLLFALASRVWKWHPAAAAALCAVFFVIDVAFFGANIIKINHGGWVPLVVAGVFFACATTWKRGRTILGNRIRQRLMPLPDFVASVKKDKPVRVKGTAIFLSGNADRAPLSLLHNLKHNKVLHERVIFMTVANEGVPYVDKEERLEYTDFDNGLHQLIAHYGFMETPDVPRLLQREAPRVGLEVDVQATTFFLGRESLVAGDKPGMPRWRVRLFSMLARNAEPATAHYNIPPGRVIEVGAQMQL